MTTPAPAPITHGTCYFDSPNVAFPPIHGIRGDGYRTLCGLRVAGQGSKVGFPQNHEHEPITWEVALRDELDTCKRCRRAR